MQSPVMITQSLLQDIVRGGNAVLVAALAPELDTQLAKACIDTKIRVAHFLAQAAYETWAFTRLVEDLSYSPKRIPEVWPKLAARAAALAYDPEALANAAYAGVDGNGDEASGDGWLFRGRGLFDLTGRENYASIGKLVGQDLTGNPDLVSQPHWAVATAVAFWIEREINAAADLDDIGRVTRLVNGGTEGITGRALLKHRALSLLSA